MSPEAARLFFVSGLTFMVGGGLGALAVRSIYGAETPDVDPGHERPLDCPPVRECPRCPPPVDCGELGVIPPSDSSTGVAADIGPADPDRAGLPASALPLAMTAVRAAIAECALSETAIDGVILLDLVATATAAGFISEATVVKTTKEIEGHQVVECVRTRALQARFAWEGPEGSLEFKLPVKVGH